MARFSLALSLLIFTCACVQAQSLAKINLSTPTSSSTAATRAVNALRKLDDQVIVYNSLGEFEESRKLARVSLTTFQVELRSATADVQTFLTQIPAGKVRTEILNALNSYRDGVFWWQQVDQPRVVQVSSLKTEAFASKPEAIFLSSIPYTVVIHWRQAHKYLGRAETALQ